MPELTIHRLADGRWRVDPRDGFEPAEVDTWADVAALVDPRPQSITARVAEEAGHFQDLGFHGTALAEHLARAYRTTPRHIRRILAAA